MEFFLDDAVEPSPDSAGIIPLIVLPAAWKGSPWRWKRHERRLNAQVARILEDLPERPERIELYIRDEHTWGAEALEAARRAVAAYGIEVRQVDEPF